MSKQDGTILLVEDNQDDAELAVLALHELQVQIDIVRDGEEALLYLHGDRADTSPLPLLVLLDVKLPKIDRPEVLRSIRRHARTRAVQTVMVSSSDLPEDIARSYALGANSYVRKPIEFSKYEMTLRRVGEYWIRINETAIVPGEA